MATPMADLINAAAAAVDGGQTPAPFPVWNTHPGVDMAQRDGFILACWRAGAETMDPDTGKAIVEPDGQPMTQATRFAWFAAIDCVLRARAQVADQAARDALAQRETWLRAMKGIA